MTRSPENFTRMITDDMRRHPKFDITLELLCSLPRYDNFAPLSELADDLGLTNQQQVNKLIGDLQKVGHRISTWNEPHVGRVAAIAPIGWEAAKAIGNEYWRMVHGGTRPLASLNLKTDNLAKAV
jgi:hypothetical protein